MAFSSVLFCVEFSVSFAVVFLISLPILRYLCSCVNEVLGGTVLVSEAEFQDNSRQQNAANGI